MEEKTQMKSSSPRNFNKVVLSHALTNGIEYNKKLLEHILFDLCCIEPGGLFVDVGGGWGHFTKIANELGFIGHCVDREKASDIASFHECDITVDPLPFEDESVKVVFCKSTIEHLYVDQLPHFFSEIKRILKPDGCVVIMTPDWKSNISQFYSVFSHVTPYTKESLYQLLCMYDFGAPFADELIQLPSVWHSKPSLFLAKILRISPLPRRIHKWVRWSKELSLIGIGFKI